MSLSTSLKTHRNEHFDLSACIVSKTSKNERVVVEISLCSSLLKHIQSILRLRVSGWKIHSRVTEDNSFHSSPHRKRLEMDGILNLVWEVGCVLHSVFYLIPASHFLPFEALDLLHYWLWLRWHKRHFPSSLLCLMMRRSAAFCSPPPPRSEEGT